MPRLLGEEVLEQPERTRSPEPTRSPSFMEWSDSLQVGRCRESRITQNQVVESRGIGLSLPYAMSLQKQLPVAKIPIDM